MNRITCFAVLLCLGCLMPAMALAQEVRKTLPGDLMLPQAQAVLAGALEKAEAIGIPVNIAVVDAGGNLKAFARMDDAFLGSIDIAVRKAVTARYFNMSTRTLGAAAQPGQPLFGIEASNDGLIIFAGGVLLTDKTGTIVGAVGVSGGTVDEDEAIALAGAAVLAK